MNEGDSGKPQCRSARVGDALGYVIAITLLVCMSCVFVASRF